MTGETVSHYKVLDKLGEGGMGVVYKAEDTKLGRPVALKFLPTHLLGNEEVRKRFEREAKSAAALDHPNVCHVHEIDEADGHTFISMSFIEGESLDKKIARGPLKLDKALSIAQQVAKGLEAAHRRGVIHRDIKPENIMVGEDGHVTIMDFGLAQLTEASRLTKTDETVGTVAYMSPEQTEGSGTDHRTDVWSLGVMLYEMITGQQPFKGDYDKAVMYSILNEQPEPITAVRTGVPMELETFLGKCLAKDREKRYRHTDELIVDLEQLADKLKLGTSTIPASVEPHAAEIRSRVPWQWVLACLFVGVLVGVAAWILKPESSSWPESIIRFVMTLDAGGQLADDFQGPSFAVSPDGKIVAYVIRMDGLNQLFLRPLNSFEARRVPTAEGASAPFWSPDGRWLGFLIDTSSGHSVRKLAIDTGEVLTVCENLENPRGISWGPNGVIVFAPSLRSSIWQVSPSGGTPRKLTTRDITADEGSHRWPILLPGGEVVVYVVGVEGELQDESRIVAERLDTGERTVLVEQGTHPLYLPTGHLVFLRQKALMAIRFDLSLMRVSGDAIPILQGVSQHSSSGTGRVSLSSNGSLVYIPANFGDRLDMSRLVWLDRSGKAQPLRGASPRYQLFPKLSPDGSRVAVQTTGPSISVFDIAAERYTQLTFKRSGAMPIWAPDSSRLAFGSSVSGGGRNLYWKSINGATVAERLTVSEVSQSASSWSPDGRYLAFGVIDPETAWDIWGLPLAGERKPEPLLRTPFFEGGAVFSPDGDWLAYTSDESGRYEVYVQPFPSTGAKWLVSDGGGQQPVWSHSGRELFYLDNHERILMAVKISTRPTFSAGAPEVLFQLERTIGIAPPQRSTYDISPDDERFLILQRDDLVEAPIPMHVVLNWFQELREKLGKASN